MSNTFQIQMLSELRELNENLNRISLYIGRISGEPDPAEKQLRKELQEALLREREEEIKSVRARQGGLNDGAL